jgi:hypothetical protein
MAAMATVLADAPDARPDFVAPIYHQGGSCSVS